MSGNTSGVGQGAGVKPFNPADVADANSQEALAAAESALAQSPIIIPLAMKGAKVSRSSASGPDTSFRQTGDPPPPPDAGGSTMTVSGIADALGFLSTIGGGDIEGALQAMMMAYQKMMNKEARDDKKMYRDEKLTELGMKAAKLDQENTRIDQLKQEAGERYDHAMAAADAEFAMGLAGMFAAVAPAFGNSTLTSVAGIVDKGISAIGNRMNAKDKNFAEYQKNEGLASDATLKAQNNAQKNIDAQTYRVEQAKDYADAQRDRVNRNKDLIGKLMDIIHSMQVNI